MRKSIRIRWTNCLHLSIIRIPYESEKVCSLIVWWIQTSDKVFYNLLMSFHMQKKTLRLTTGGGAAYNVTKSLIKEVWVGRGGKLFGELCVPLKKPLLRPWLFFLHSSNEIDNTHQANVLRILAFLSLSFGQKPALILPSDSGDCHFLVHSRLPFLEKRLIDGVLPIQPRFHANVNSFLSRQYTIDSMVFCSHLPNLVNAGWLWIISRRL